MSKKIHSTEDWCTFYLLSCMTNLETHGHDGVHGVDVEEGKNGDRHFLRSAWVGRSEHGHLRVIELRDICDHVEVGQAHALRGAGGAGRVGQGRGVVVDIKSFTLKNKRVW